MKKSCVHTEHQIGYQQYFNSKFGLKSCEGKKDLEIKLWKYSIKTRY